ncbi:hypothetical protein ACFP1Z_28250 [Streptomyces gamaensis]|uniref:Uncharacterized protein n=1 Tax=Streptomyces gamaensis TaxID=1763542 RepID=A0ABW0Z9Q3_9ACTN
MRLIYPTTVPQYIGNFEELEKAATGLRGDADGIRMHGLAVHGRFQLLDGHYQAPEIGQLLATTRPVADKAGAFADHLETVADALDVFVQVARPLAKRLEQLRDEAAAFLTTVEGDDEWTFDSKKVDRHEKLRTDINATVSAFQDAERNAADRITAIVGGTRFVKDDGSHQVDLTTAMYGYDAETMNQAEMPWGSPVEQSHHAWDLGYQIKSFAWEGFAKDGFWEGLKGLGSLVTFDGDAWGQLGDTVAGIGHYSVSPFTSLLDLAFGEDEPDPDVERQKKAARDFGKSFVAWDMWEKNPGQAAGTVVFNVLTLGIGAAAAGKLGEAGKAGTAAKVGATALRAGEYLDPLSASLKLGGKALGSLPKISDVTAAIQQRVGAALGADRVHSVLELADGSKLRLEDGKFIPVDADGKVVKDAAHHEPRADQRAVSGDMPAERELARAKTGAHTHESTARGGSGPVGDHSGGGSSSGAPNHGGRQPDTSAPSAGGHSGHSGEHHASTSNGAEAERANEPVPELTPEERAAHRSHLEEVEGRHPEDFDHLQRDPDDNWGIKPKTQEEARVGLDLRDQGRLPADIRRPPQRDSGEFYSASTGRYYDIKGVHSDWPPFNNVRDKSQPFKGAYNPANNGRWVNKLKEQIVGHKRIVILDIRNANQAAIDDVRSIVERNGWEDNVIWYP